jgi:hypothetical protein
VSEYASNVLSYVQADEQLINDARPGPDPSGRFPHSFMAKLFVGRPPSSLDEAGVHIRAKTLTLRHYSSPRPDPYVRTRVRNRIASLQAEALEG